MRQRQRQKIIYSLKVHIELELRGFHSIGTIPNPRHSEFSCWIYEWNNEIEKAFLEITKEGNYE